MTKTFSTIILAGGKGSRFGQEKASLKIDGTSLLERVIGQLAQLSSEVIVVYSQGQNAPQYHETATIVTDIYPDKGALGGVYTGLMTSGSHYNLIVACDMPFLNPDLLRYMIEVSCSHDIIIPYVDQNVEPLHAVYSKDCLSYIEDMFEQGNIRIRDLLMIANIRYVGQSEVDRYDPEHLSMFNINYRADMQKVMSLKETLL
ncbi:MAG: molybdenum cofactor guanylyltransferase [Chloroflexi bacterium]|jgi:molybdenum cofactor guanylyltransferase|nr:molybdenum cofactor guanylyltransferase [Chloroflexota bacterium]MBT7082568.1 molybdenum cofactor guanylyltransferase [Chloroflexota bacterium]MBT7289113.1 molybdenum cofactor guanylyltransferase [Chloroflexota bacterium]